MREIIELETRTRETLIDITGRVDAIARHSGVRDGLVNVYARAAAAGSS